MSNYTIHVSVSIDNEINNSIEFNFLSEQLNWENLVTLIQSTTNSIETPIVLYFKRNDTTTIESLDSQEQLEALLSAEDTTTLKGLRFYGQKEIVDQAVFVYPGNAFVRLGEFVEQHKDVVSSSRRIARLVGILASFIAQDSSDYDFDNEFEILDELVERKTNKRNRRERLHGETVDTAVEGEEQEQQEDEEEQDPREVLFGPCGSFGGRGGFFGGRGRGRHHHGRHHPAEGIFSNDRRGGPCGEPFGNFGGRGGPCGETFGNFGGRGGPCGETFGNFGGRGGPCGETFGNFGGRGEFEGDKHGYGRHGFGDWGKPHHFGHHGDFFNGSFGKQDGFDEKMFGGRKCHGRGRRHGERFTGPSAYPEEGQNSAEEKGDDSAPEEIKAPPFGPIGEGFRGFPGHHYGGPFGRHGGPAFGRHGGPAFGRHGGPAFGRHGGPAFGRHGGPAFGRHGGPAFGRYGGPAFGRRGSPFDRHHGGGKHGFGDSFTKGDKSDGCGKKRFHRHGGPYSFGHHGGFSEDSSSEDDILAFKKHLMKQHFKHQYHHGGKDFFKSHHENHFHFD